MSLRALFFSVLLAAFSGTGFAQAAPDAPPRQPAPTKGGEAPKSENVKPLGNDRFQIGKILVDKRAATFTVPGKITNVGKPLEYLASTPGGSKDYESLMELDANAVDFNVACILIGLERDPNLVPFRRFSTKPITGPALTLTLRWTQDGKRREMSAGEALLDSKAGVKPETVQWVYIGSPVSIAAPYFVADRTGTLIGFIHDPASIIEVIDGLGIGAYGSIQGNPALPPVGSAVELVVTAAPAAKK